MLLPVDGEVFIPRQVVRQKADAALDGHGVGPLGQNLHLRLCQAGAGLQKAPGKGPEVFQIQPHLFQIGLVLGGGGSAEADGVAEVIGGQPRHHCVQINDADRLPAVLVQQYIVDLGVVVGSPDGQLAPLSLVVEAAGPLLPRQGEGHFLLHFLPSPAGILFDGGAEFLIAVHGIVKIGDGLHQPLCREVPQGILEGAKALGALVEVRRRFRPLQADAVVHKAVDAPGPALAVVVIGLAVGGVNIADHGHPAALLLPQEGADGGHVVHQRVHIGEYIPVYPLEYVAAAGVGGDQEGLVDVAALDLADAGHLPVDGEMPGNLRLAGQPLLPAAQQQDGQH